MHWRACMYMFIYVLMVPYIPLKTHFVMLPTLHHYIAQRMQGPVMFCQRSFLTANGEVAFQMALKKKKKKGAWHWETFQTRISNATNSVRYPPGVGILNVLQYFQAPFHVRRLLRTGPVVWQPRWNFPLTRAIAKENKKIKKVEELILRGLSTKIPGYPYNHFFHNTTASIFVSLCPH